MLFHKAPYAGKNALYMANNVLPYRGATNVWKPKVTPLSELKTGTPQNPSTYTDSGETFVQRTSLAADKQVSLMSVLHE